MSITNGDNVYGSNVVHNVLHYPVSAETGVSPDMLLAPLDSRNFAEHGKLRYSWMQRLRAVVYIFYECIFWSLLFLCDYSCVIIMIIDYHKRQEKELNDRCKGIHAMLEYNLLTYTTQPIPFLGRVDLAAVFLDRRKFAAENVLFGMFTLYCVYTVFCLQILY